MSKELDSIKEKTKVLFKDKIYIDTEEIYKILEQALSTPTVEQVCKAINDYLINEIKDTEETVRYEKNEYKFVFNHSGNTLSKLEYEKYFRVYYSFPLDLVMLIGKFYQGVIENEKEV